MPGLRFLLDLYVPEDPNGILVGGIKIPSTLAAQVPTILNGVRYLKTYARKVDDKTAVRATYHICKHDIGQSCGPETEI